MTPEEHVDTIGYLTGWDVTFEECMKMSEKIWNLTRSHYLERNGGPGRQFDVAPARQLEEKVPSGPAKGQRVGVENFEFMLDDYYHNRGWDKSGHPTREVLEILGLPHVADNLEKAGLLGEPFADGVPKVRGKRLKPKAM